MAVQPGLCRTWSETPDRFSHNEAHLAFINLCLYCLCLSENFYHDSDKFLLTISISAFFFLNFSLKNLKLINILPLFECHLTTLCEFLCNFWIFGELDVVVGLVFHDDSVKVNVVADFKLGDIDVGFLGQGLG